MSSFEPVIGLEVHAQLNTQSKIFCTCSTAFMPSENVNVCPVCTGLPGSLPVLNKQVVEFAIRLALATNCRINPQSVFARKNYFYPDLPKGYQISQYDQPFAEEGFVEISIDGQKKKIRLIRIHMEEDAGKNVHTATQSFVNLNRAGIPLLEIVSHADIRSPSEASLYLKELRKLLRYLQISEANMEEGNLRCDVNISLRKAGTETFGTRAEIKNINSFRFVEKAILYEIDRQTEVLQSGQKVIQETRLWDSVQDKTLSMRSKEEAHDYRYFPDPDLLPLTIEASWIEKVREGLPELASQKKERFHTVYGLSDYDASLLVQEKELATYFEQAVQVCHDPKKVSNWILSELLREISIVEILTCPVSSQQLGNLVKLINDGTISGKMAKSVFEKMLKGGGDPQDIVKKEGLVQVSDISAIEKMIEDILEKNQDAVLKYRAGQVKLLSFFVGEVMKQTKGKANPKVVNDCLKKRLEKKS